MTGNGWACCNILFPVVCHTLTGQPTASTDTQRLHRNMDISKFSKRTLNFDISRFDCTCTRHENINNELLNTSQALCWLDTYDVVISHSELLWITCTVYNYDSSSQLSFSALAVFSRNALYKSTFYLLTYLSNRAKETWEDSWSNIALQTTCQPEEPQHEEQIREYHSSKTTRVVTIS